MEEWTFGDNRGLDNPAVRERQNAAPTDCGLCNMHTSHTGLANVDLTNRCNLTCPVCFANANAAGYLYEPDFETVRKMLQALRDQKPVAARIVQFSGGEPTIYPRFLDVLRMAQGDGLLAISRWPPTASSSPTWNSPSSARKPGCTRSTCSSTASATTSTASTRGESLWEKKLQCIENVRKAGLKIVFVPTIVKGLNDHQIGDILRLALEYIDCSAASASSRWPSPGRIAKHELEAKRFTLSDFAHAVEEQTGICRAATKTGSRSPASRRSPS